MRRLLTTLCLGWGLSGCWQSELHPPVRLEASGELIHVESPGYAAPCWADADGDGREELLVGQFAGGKIKRYRHLGELRFAGGQWLEVAGEPAEVPGVW